MCVTLDSPSTEAQHRRGPVRLLQLVDVCLLLELVFSKRVQWRHNSVVYMKGRRHGRDCVLVLNNQYQAVTAGSLLAAPSTVPLAYSAVVNLDSRFNAEASRCTNTH